MARSCDAALPGRAPARRCGGKNAPTPAERKHPAIRNLKALKSGQAQELRKRRTAGLDGRRDRVAAKPPRARGDHNRRSESTHRVWPKR